MVIQKRTPILTRVGYRLQLRDKHVHKSRIVKTDNNQQFPCGALSSRTDRHVVVTCTLSQITKLG